MIDRGQRHRRRVLGSVLIGLAGLLVVAIVLFGWTLVQEMLLGVVSDSYALVTAVVVIVLALAGSGAYLLRTVGGR